jgi:hypothetical protein
MADRIANLTPEMAHQLRPEFGSADWYRVQMRSGKLWGAKVGGRWYTDEQAIDEMVEKAQNFKRKRRNRVMT